VASDEIIEPAPSPAPVSEERTVQRLSGRWDRRPAQARDPAARARLDADETRQRLSTSLIRTPVVPGATPIPAEVLNPERLTSVVQTGLLDTDPESCFDDLVQLACQVVDGEHGFFTVVDGRRSFWKSAVGVDTTGGREARVEDSLCQVVISADEPLVVDDARNDERVRGLGAVAELGMEACVSYPVRDGSGRAIGGLCVSTTRRRSWTESQQRALATLARAVSTEVQLRSALTVSRVQLGNLRRERDEYMALAQVLQSSLLPPRLPAIPGVDVAAAYLPAGGGDVVGDFYDLFESDGSWWVVMGDVCGHGVAAATTTALARYTVRTEAGHNEAVPSEVLLRLHKALRSRGEGGRLLTVALANVRCGSAGLTGNLCSAGHEPPLIRRAGGTVEVPPAHGQMLGVTDDPVLRDVPIALGPGDALVLLTDGVTESRPGRGAELFGEERLILAVGERCEGLDAAGIVDQVMHAVTAYSNGNHADDTAVMVIRVPLASRRP
jgi:serine phosphatase RsbU (regulator of sigma subunit)